MKELKQIVFTIFNSQIEGADVYYNNGSTWLIFTNKKKWVFELTKEGTLWYNYYFFNNLFGLLSLNVVENQHYITEWVENFIQNGVKHTHYDLPRRGLKIDDTIKNGVKHTDWCQIGTSTSIEDTIQNGVKDTRPEAVRHNPGVEDTIQNWVKETKLDMFEDGLAMEETIQNGVKETKSYVNNDFDMNDAIENGIKNTVNHPARPQEVVDTTIKNGIKQTKQEPSQRTWMSEQVVGNGIKETNPHFLEIINPLDFEPVIKEMKRMNEVHTVLENGIKEIKTPNHKNPHDGLKFLKYNGTDSLPDLIDELIQNGIKEVKELPDKSGELMGYGEYYARQKNGTYPHNDIVNDVIRDGIKETKYCELHSLMRADHIIKDGIKETWGYDKQPQIRVNEVISGGINETNWRRVDNHPSYLDNIIKSNEK